MTARLYREGSSAVVSGCLMCFELLQVKAGGLEGEAAARVRAFEKKVFFTPRMSATQFDAAAESLQQQFSVLPPRGISLVRTMLEKLPDSCGCKAELLRQLHRHDVLNLPPPFGIAQLIEIVRPDVVSSSGGNGEAHMSETPPGVSDTYIILS